MNVYVPEYVKIYVDVTKLATKFLIFSKTKQQETVCSKEQELKVRTRSKWCDDMLLQSLTCYSHIITFFFIVVTEMYPYNQQRRESMNRNAYERERRAMNYINSHREFLGEMNGFHSSPRTGGRFYEESLSGDEFGGSPRAYGGKASQIRGRLRSCLHRISTKINCDLSRYVIVLKDYVTRPEHRYIVPDMVRISEYVRDNIIELRQSNTLQMKIVQTIIQCLECFRNHSDDLEVSPRLSDDWNPIADRNRRGSSVLARDYNNVIDRQARNDTSPRGDMYTRRSYDQQRGRNFQNEGRNDRQGGSFVRERRHEVRFDNQNVSRNNWNPVQPNQGSRNTSSTDNRRRTNWNPVSQTTASPSDSNRRTNWNPVSQTTASPSDSNRRTNWNPVSQTTASPRDATSSRNQSTSRSSTNVSGWGNASGSRSPPAWNTSENNAADLISIGSSNRGNDSNQNKPEEAKNDEPQENTTVETDRNPNNRVSENEGNHENGSHSVIEILTGPDSSNHDNDVDSIATTDSFKKAREEATNDNDTDEEELSEHQPETYNIGEYELVAGDNISGYWLKFLKERMACGDPIQAIEKFGTLPFILNEEHVFGDKFRSECAHKACDILLYRYFPTNYAVKSKEHRNKLEYYSSTASHNFKIPKKKAKKYFTLDQPLHAAFEGVYNEALFRRFADAIADSVYLDAGIQFSVLCKMSDNNIVEEEGLEEELLRCRCPCSVDLGKSFRKKYHLYEPFDAWCIEAPSEQQCTTTSSTSAILTRRRVAKNCFRSFNGQSYKIRCEHHENASKYDPEQLYNHLRDSTSTRYKRGQVTRTYYDPFHTMYAIFLDLLYCNEEPRSCYFEKDQNDVDIALECTNKKNSIRN